MRQFKLFQIKKSKLFIFTIFIFLLFSDTMVGQISQNLNPTYGYIFSNSTGTYTALSGSTVFQSGTAINTDGVSSAITLPFVFTFNGIKTKTIFISNNGFITFGIAPAVGNYVPLSTTTSSGYDGAIAGSAMNCVASTASGATPEISHGSAGSDYVVQFQDIGQSGFAAIRMTYQIVLKADGKTIQIIYGPNNVGVASAGQCQVGLRGTNDEDWNNRTLSSGGNWNTTGGAAGSANTSAMSLTATTTLPTSGQTFQWVPTSYIPTYNTSPTTVQEFTSWVNGSGPSNVPSTNFATNGYGNASWQIDNNPGTTTTTGWGSVSSYTYSPVDYVGASGGHSARFHAGNANSPQVGYLDYYVDLSSFSGNTSLYFYHINTSGTDKLQIFLSTDGGSTFTQLGSDIGTSASWTAKSLSLGSTNSATSIIRFKATADFGSTDIGIDHVFIDLTPSPCISPADQPTSLITGTNTSTSVMGSFSAASSNPSGYLVVRSIGALNTNPVDGTTYTAAATLGNGTVIQSSSSLSFTSSSLTSNTQYTFTIFAYNNTSCSGGPAYLTTTPLTGTLTTCPAAPTVAVNSNITSSGFTVSWTASAAGGSAGPINYTVEVYTDAGYTMPITGSPFNSMSNVTQTITGLNSNTTYYYRILANNTFCNSTYLTGSVYTGHCLVSTNSQASWISVFNTTGGITNITHSAGSGASGGYLDLTSVSVSNYIGQTTNIALTAGGPTVGFAIWIDWNNNLVFESGERVFVTSIYVTSTTGSFTVPAAQANGSYRMRVVTDYNNSAPSNPCLILTRGEYKDFTFLVIDQPAACSAPTDQATSLIAGTNTSSSLAGSFSAASSNPSGYLVVRSIGALNTNPVDGTTYTTAATLGNGTVIQSSSSLSFTSSSLISNSQYTITIFAYNNTSCSGGPAYLTTTPLTGTLTTCPAAPTAAVNSNITTSGFTVSWTASAAGGSAGPINYTVEVYTDAGYTMPITGSPFNSMTNVTQAITGLNSNTTYYYRILANNTFCNSTFLTGTVTTLCNAETAPTSLQTFATFTGAAPAPACWSEATGSLGLSSTLSGSTSAWLLKPSGFANASSSNPGASINLYSTKNDWIISQPIDLGMTPNVYRVAYKMAVTNYNGTTSQSTLGTHKVDIVVSTDGGATWSNTNIIKTYTGVGTYSNTGQMEYIWLTGFTGVIKIAFVATTTSTSPDIDFHLDDFIVEPIPVPTITSLGTTSGCPGNTLEINGTNFSGVTAANVQIGGTPVVSITSNTGTLLTVVVGSGTTGNVTVTIGANTATSTQTYTVNPKPTASASSNSPVCAGSAITLMGMTDGTSYAWTGPSGFTSTDQNPTNATVGGTYTFTATSSLGCTSDPATTVVVVNPTPSAVTINQGSSVSKCSTTVIPLDATGGTLSNITILSQNFNSTPTGWTTVNNSTGGTPANAAWTLRPNGYLYGSATFNSNDASQFYLSNSDAQGSSGTTATILNSPAMNLMNYSSANLNFYHYYRFNATESAKVEVSLNNSTWTTLVTYSSSQGSSSSFNNVNIDLTAYVGNPTVYLRFKYDASYDYYWAIDNVVISGNQNTIITWSPTTGLSTDAGGSMNYNGMDHAPTIYAGNTTNQYYTATATSAQGCTSSASITVNVEGTLVTSSADAGAGTLRAALACVTNGGTIMYDQPTTVSTVLTAPLTIDKNVTIMGLSSSSRPEITTSTSGISIDAGKTLTLKDVDLKSTAPTQTFGGAGSVSISGTTVAKQ